MAYSRKDVTDGIKKKKKKAYQTEELMNIIDEAHSKEKKEKEEKTKETELEKENKIDESEMDNEFADDFYSAKKHSTKKPKKSSPISIPFTALCIIMILSSIVYFASIIYTDYDVLQIIGGVIICIFTILYVVICFSLHRNKMASTYVSVLLLIAFFLLQVHLPGQETTIISHKMQNFSGKSLTEVVKWANKNNLKITQEYEYSDMVPEYEIISQNIKPGTNIDDIDEIVVAVSEGPNPYKEIIVPSMLTWDSERVINYVMSNYLNNVIVEFVESDQVKDTVIEQSKSGSLKRNDELKLVFSYGDEGNSNEVNIIDFKNMTKFEIEFFIKQHKLNYDFVYDYSKSIKEGYGMKQSIDPGTVVAVDGDKIQITISKGPKIIIPDLENKSISELTEWAIENRLKLEFFDQYDDSVKKGKIISIDKKKGDVVEQGTVVQVTLSLGALKMPKFKNIDAFYAWADKYDIKYETQHEFSDSVAVGEIIRFSYKTGSVIKNDEAITVVISDGSKRGVPNLKGLTKTEAIKKCKNVDLNYNFIYKNNSAKKDTVIAQSISSGSEVSSGTTITITLSNGNNGNNTNNSNTGNNQNSGNNNQSNPKPTPSTSPKPSCNSCNVTGIKNEVYNNYSGYQATANALISYIEGQCPGIDVQVRSVDSDKNSGVFVSGYYQGDKDNDGNQLTSCSTVYIYLAK